MKLLCNKEGFITLSHASKRVQLFAQSEIAAEYRYFEDSEWHVHKTAIRRVVEYSVRSCKETIDASQLPASLRGGLRMETSEDPYRVLHVMESAPLYVVKAVYKALSFRVHPDRGGTTEQAARVNLAYQRILSEHQGRATADSGTEG